MTIQNDSESVRQHVREGYGKIAVSGGSPAGICSFSGSDPEGASWGPDNRIRFVPNFGGGIQVVPAEGGNPQVVLDPDFKADRYVLAWPNVLPDGKGLIFAVASGRTTNWDDGGSIFALLEQGDDEVSHRAAEVLGRLPLGKVQEYLEGAIRAESARTRRRAAMLLGHLKGGAGPKATDRTLKGSRVAAASAWCSSFGTSTRRLRTACAAGCSTGCLCSSLLKTQSPCQALS